MKWVVRTSSLRVADSGGDRVYRSLEEAPEDLREKVRAAFEGSSSQTILIANQEAYDHIAGEHDDEGEPLADRLRRSMGAPLVRRRGASRRRRDRTRGAAEADQSWRLLLAAGLAAIGALWGLWLWAIQSGTS